MTMAARFAVVVVHAAGTRSRPQERARSMREPRAPLLADLKQPFSSVHVSLPVLAVTL